MTSLPSLIVQVEFPRQVFARVVGAVIAANQFMYALGPGLLGWLRDLSGSYRSGLVACMALLLVACVVVLGGAACAAPQRAAVPR
jgi:cyanate permease